MNSSLDSKTNMLLIESLHSNWVPIHSLYDLQQILEMFVTEPVQWSEQDERKYEINTQ
jgi:hypothetical protein